MADKIIIDEKDFLDARKDLESFDEARENQIRTCRDVIRISKKIIYAVHRDDFETAKQEIISIKETLARCGDERLDNNMLTVAWQEYVEALCYYHVIADGRLPSRADLGASSNDYLLGLCDLCGELVRRAINSAAQGDVEMTKKMKDLVADIFAQFLQYDLRNSELRKKSDGLKYHLNKLEEILYDLSIHSRS